MQTLIDNKYIPALEALNYNINDAISEFVLLKIHNKISEFKNEIAFYSKKYNSRFDDFEKYINEMQDSENMGEYNDYLAWKFSRESLGYYENQLKNIK
jgi:hypothetical protein